MPSTADAAVGDGTVNSTAAAAVRDSAAAAAVVSSPVSMTSRLSESVSESSQAGCSPSSSSPCSYSAPYYQLFSKFLCKLGYLKKHLKRYGTRVHGIVQIKNMFRKQCVVHGISVQTTGKCANNLHLLGSVADLDPDSVGSICIWAPWIRIQIH